MCDVNMFREIDGERKRGEGNEWMDGADVN